MKFYKEVARKALFHNGKPFDKGETVRERVPLSDVNFKNLKENPELTNCNYILINEGEKDEKTIRAEAFAKAKELFAAGKLAKEPPKNIKTEDLLKLIE